MDRPVGTVFEYQGYLLKVCRSPKEVDKCNYCFLNEHPMGDCISTSIFQCNAMYLKNVSQGLSLDYFRKGKTDAL